MATRPRRAKASPRKQTAPSRPVPLHGVPVRALDGWVLVQQVRVLVPQLLAERIESGTLPSRKELSDALSTDAGVLPLDAGAIRRLRGGAEAIAEISRQMEHPSITWQTPARVYPAWFSTGLTLVAQLHGKRAAQLLVHAANALAARKVDWRAFSARKLARLVELLERDERERIPFDPVDALAWKAIRELREARAWCPEALFPRQLSVIIADDLLTGPVSGPIDVGGMLLPDQVRAVGNRLLETGRFEPHAHDDVARALLRWGLAFPPDDVAITAENLRFAVNNPAVVGAAVGSGIGLGTALELARMAGAPHIVEGLAPHLAAGLNLSDLMAAARWADIRELAVPGIDSVSARRWCTWVGALMPSLRAHGISLRIAPESVQRVHVDSDDEDLVLLHGLSQDILAGLDDPAHELRVALALFQVSPEKVRAVVKKLATTRKGLGKKQFPDFSAWIDHNPVLDRYVHLSALSGDGVKLPDDVMLEHQRASAMKAELKELQQLKSPTPTQRVRVLQLMLEENGSNAPSPGRVVRALEQRIPQLLWSAWRHQREVLTRSAFPARAHG